MFSLWGFEGLRGLRLRRLLACLGVGMACGRVMACAGHGLLACCLFCLNAVCVPRQERCLPHHPQCFTVHRFHSLPKLAACCGLARACLRLPAHSYSCPVTVCCQFVAAVPKSVFCVVELHPAGFSYGRGLQSAIDCAAEHSLHVMLAASCLLGVSSHTPLLGSVTRGRSGPFSLHLLPILPPSCPNQPPSCGLVVTARACRGFDLCGPHPSGRIPACFRMNACGRWCR